MIAIITCLIFKNLNIFKADKFKFAFLTHILQVLDIPHVPSSYHIKQKRYRERAVKTVHSLRYCYKRGNFICVHKHLSLKHGKG